MCKENHNEEGTGWEVAAGAPEMDELSLITTSDIKVVVHRAMDCICKAAFCHKSLSGCRALPLLDKGVVHAEVDVRCPFRSFGLASS